MVYTPDALEEADAAPTSAHHAKVVSQAFLSFLSTYQCCNHRCLDLIPLATKKEYIKIWDISAAARRDLAFKELQSSWTDVKRRDGPFVTFAGLDFVQVQVQLPSVTAPVPICRRACWH